MVGITIILTFGTMKGLLALPSLFCTFVFALKRALFKGTEMKVTKKTKASPQVSLVDMSMKC